MCWKYIDECSIDSNLLNILLTKFNERNKRENLTFLTTLFNFALYLALIYTCVLNCMCWVAKNSVLLMPGGNKKYVWPFVYHQVLKG